MTLHDVLKTLNLDTLVLIDSMTKPPHGKGRPQYKKLRNIPWEKLRNELDYEVSLMAVNQAHGGLYIKIFKKN